MKYLESQCSIMISNKNSKLKNKLKNGDSASIVCFGNSITWGHILPSYLTKKPTKDNYPFNLEKILRKYYKNKKIKVFNEGHDGWTVNDALKKENGIKKVLLIKPDLVIIMFGVIEVISFPRIKLEDYIKGLNKLILKIKKSGSEVLLMSPTPIFVFDKELSLYSKKTIYFAKENKLDFIDMRKEVFNYMKKNNLHKWNILKIDNVHFQEDKYKIISEIVFNKYFLKLLKNT